MRRFRTIPSAGSDIMKQVRDRHEWRAAPPRVLLLTLVVAVLLPALLTVRDARAQAVRYPQPASHDQPVSHDTAFFRGLAWRNVGPARGGRSIAVAGTSARPHEYWFGATGGGVWKTTDGGTTWAPVSDGQFRTSSVGAIGQCEANPDIVYVGMGEVALRGNIMQGDGVYRTSDGGVTWRHVGLPDSHAIGRIRVHPTDCGVAYAAVLGHPYGPNTERGVFRTRDGGHSWERVLHRGTRAGAVDLVMDPSNPDRLFAGFWQVQRTPWSLESGGAGSGLFMSTDGGNRWTELTKSPGLPRGTWGKVGVAVSGADPDRVWAIIEAEEGGVFRSDDGGRTWERTNSDRSLRQRAFYYTRIYAHPTDRDRVYVLNVAFHGSEDGGVTFPRTIRVPHADNHDLWIDPQDPQRWINANDGGANVSVNAGQSWTGQAYPTAQLYHITVTNHEPYWVCGAQQDNSTACMPSRPSRVLPPFMPVGGGESGYIASDPDNPDIIYAGSYSGYLSRFDARTGAQQTITVWPDNPMGHSASEIRERFQWTFPIVFSRHGPRRLYVASQHLWVSTNEGMSWDRISPDLTRADPKTMGPSGGPITKDQTGVETYATIFTVAPSPHDGNTIWIGTDDGRVQLTRDHGGRWTNITPRDMPDFTRVSMVEASPHRPGAAYVAGKRYQLDDRRPYIWHTEDYGRTWRRIDAGIPDGDFVHVVREDPVRPGLLFAGAEHGVWISFDNGASWTSFNRNLPVTQVPSLVIKDNDLVVATHGRSAWVMDNITPLRELDARIATAPVHLFQPVDPVRGVDGTIAVTYHLAEPAQSIELEFVDAAGTVLRRFAAGAAARAERDGADPEGRPQDARMQAPGGFAPQPSLRAGANRFTWDLRLPGATAFPGMILWAAGTNGPRILPGRYEVRLRVDDHAPVARSFEYRLDPRRPHVTLDDARAQHELAVRVRDATSAANDAVVLIRDVVRQVDERIEQDRSVARRANPLKQQLAAIEEQLYQVRNRSNQDPLNYPIRLNNRIAALLGVVEGVDGAPTRQAYQVFELLSGELDVQLARLQQVLGGIDELNRFLRSRNLEPVSVPAPRRAAE
jgi:photosystem II stability/assembly factor-like uncharacterized protein